MCDPFGSHAFYLTRLVLAWRALKVWQVDERQSEMKCFDLINSKGGEGSCFEYGSIFFKLFLPIYLHLSYEELINTNEAFIFLHLVIIPFQQVL